MDHVDIRDLILELLMNHNLTKSAHRRNLDGAASGIDLKLSDGSEFQIQVHHRKHADNSEQE